MASPRITLVKWRTIGLLLIVGVYIYNDARISRLRPSIIDTPSVLLPSQREIEEELMFDVISIGSVTKIDFLQAQQATFGQSTRHFWSITEDAETCAQQLTVEQYCSIMDFCTSPAASNMSSTIGHFLTARLFRPKYGPIRPSTRHKVSSMEQPCLAHNVTPQAIGWLCAQQRPLMGLRQAVEAYRTSLTLPHYLFIIDDDTYVNFETLLPLLHKHYPSDEIHVLAGCVLRNPQGIHFSFPFGGFGTIFTRAALQQRLLRPVDCTAPSATQDVSIETERYRRFVCWQIQNNQLGERDYFQNHMSVADLYSQAAVPYTQPWSRRGFCWHSDHVLAYFLNYYHIGRSEIPLVPLGATTAPTVHNRAFQRLLVASFGANRSHSLMYSMKSLQQCDNRAESCDPATSVLCHNIPPEQMQALWKSRSSKT